MFGEDGCRARQLGMMLMEVLGTGKFSAGVGMTAASSTVDRQDSTPSLFCIL